MGTIIAEAQELLQAEGTVWLFAGQTSDGHDITFGVDHRPARALYDLICEDGPVPVSLECWQVLS